MIAVTWIEPTKKGNTILLLCRKDVALDSLRSVAALRSQFTAGVKRVKVIAANRMEPPKQWLRTLYLGSENVACSPLELIT